MALRIIGFRVNLLTARPAFRYSLRPVSAESPAPEKKSASKWSLPWLRRQKAELPQRSEKPAEKPYSQNPTDSVVWRFRELRPDETLQNASHIEFFHTEALQSPVEALVREDIQNRLDAAAEAGQKVTVRYLLGRGDPENGHARWFERMAQHLDSPQVREELGGGSELLSRPLSWLAIEDFGTTGLQGDPLTYHDIGGTGRVRNDFYWFIRNVGRSGKRAQERGRWGLGKLVYALASDIRSFFASTVRRNDGRRLLIGRSTLTMHLVNERALDSEGYFGRFESPHLPYFATPETEPAVLEDFTHDFLLTRRADEPGLSVVIPWPDADITFDTLIESIVRNWFWMLLQDKMKVHVTDAVAGQTLTLSHDTFVESLGDKRSNALDDVRKTLTFALAVREFQSAPRHFFKLQPCADGTPPRWDNASERFSSPEALDHARSAFRSGDLVGFEVPVRVRRVDGKLDEMSSFQVYVQRAGDEWRAREIFLRDGLSIAGAHTLLAPGVQAMINVEGGAISTLMGDAESPAHTRWERGNRNFRGRYEHGPSILTFVQRAAERLCAVMDGP